MNSLLFWHAKALERLDGLGLLLLRVWVGQEFLTAGLAKLNAGLSAPEWFAGLAFPAPLHLLSAALNWLLAGLGEVAFSLAVLAGLGTRLAAVGLLFITYVAVATVHFDLGWAGWNQMESDAGKGFKVPLLLAVMTVTLVTQGAGRYSLDALWKRCQSRRAVVPHP